MLTQIREKASPEAIHQLLKQAKNLKRYPELYIPFVGRKSEQMAIAAAWEQSKVGCGDLFLIGGEAGIGKTELARQLVSFVKSDEGLALWGACNELERDVPYRPWIDVLRHAL